MSQPENQTILVVDDHRISRLALTSLLGKAGYRTVEAENGEEAWRLLAEQEISLVLADFCMPKLDGFELTKRIKAHPDLYLTPVVIVTGADDIASRIAAFEHGADEILPKPVINEELLARVRNLLRFSEAIAERLQMELNKAELESELAISKLRQEEDEVRNRLYHDVLFAATGGTLNLMTESTMNELLEGWDEVSTLALSDTSEIGKARQITEALALKAGMTPDAVGDVVLCVSEAVTNGMKFGTHVNFQCGLREGRIHLYIEDNGPGLDRALLPQVTLHKGFSTHSSLGMGFSLMLETMDRVGLYTGAHGTSVLLSKECISNQQIDIDSFLERFAVSLD